MKKNNELTPQDFIKLDYKNTHLLKRFINENGKIIDVGKYFIITKNIKKYKNKNYKAIKQKFSYNSKENNFLTIDELKKIIKKIKS